MAAVLDTRLQQAQVKQVAPIDLVASLVNDELQRRQDRLLARRHKQARFRDPDRSLDVLLFHRSDFFHERLDLLYHILSFFTPRKGLSRALLNFASGRLRVRRRSCPMLRHVSNEAVGRGHRIQRVDQVL